MASRLLRCAAYIALLFAVYALMPYVLRAMLLAAVSVISEITATGPTASARLVPNKA